MAFTSSELTWTWPASGMGVFDAGYSNIGISGSAIVSTGAGACGFTATSCSSVRVQFDVSAMRFFSATSNTATNGYRVDINSYATGKWRISLATVNATYESDTVGTLRDWVNVDWTTGSTVELMMVRSHNTFSVYQIISNIPKLMVQLKAKGNTYGGAFDQTGTLFAIDYQAAGATIRRIRWVSLYKQSEPLGPGVGSRLVAYSDFSNTLNPYNPYTDMNGVYGTQASFNNAGMTNLYSSGGLLNIAASVAQQTVLTNTTDLNKGFNEWGMSCLVAFKLMSGGFTMPIWGGAGPTLTFKANTGVAAGYDIAGVNAGGKGDTLGFSVPNPSYGYGEWMYVVTTLLNEGAIHRNPGGGTNLKFYRGSSVFDLNTINGTPTYTIAITGQQPSSHTWGNNYNTGASTLDEIRYYVISDIQNTLTTWDPLPLLYMTGYPAYPGFSDGVATVPVPPAETVKFIDMYGRID